MNISFRESCFIEKIPNKEGGFGFLATHKALKDGTVIKVIRNISLEKESTIMELLGEKKIEGSGYPIEEYKVDDKLQGFIMSYFPNSYAFDYIINRDMFTHEERVKAALDCTKQLKEIHNKRFLLNDIALSNSLMDKDGGHLIDFDAVTKNYPKKAESHYELALNGKILRPNSNIDKLKHALTNLSLIYGINFENIIDDRTNDVNNLFSLFKRNKEIYNLLYSYLSTDCSKPYFDVLIDSLKDEERIRVESAKMYRKIHKLV